MTDIVIDLPFPPSGNRIWRVRKAGKNLVSISPEYANWRRQADLLTISMGSCKRVKRIAGPFEAGIVLQRRRGDLDNRIKGVLDWAQSRLLIADDKFCEKLTVEWGDAPHGCRLTMHALNGRAA
jgi:Holliday junction resolvase RusA-like endonuclease